MRRSILTAVVIAVAALAWILSGQFGPVADGAEGERPAAAPAETGPAQADPPRPEVRVAALTARPYVRDVVVRGRTEALRQVTVKAETHGRVVAVRVREGQRVQAGAALIELAAEDREARVREAEARVKQRQIEYDASRSLRKKGFNAETTLAGAAANLGTAKAYLAQTRVTLDHLVARAPFDGVVERRQAEIGDFLDVGDAVATVVDEDPFLVIGQVTERQVASLKVGGPGSAKLVGGEVVRGKIRYIALVADPETRTFRVELEVANPKRRLRDGVTAEIRFKADTVAAHFVSPAVLTLNDAGEVGLRTVDGDGTVRFRPAEIVGDSTDGVWLAGLPDAITVITVGQDFVKAGQRVIPRPAEPAPAS